MAGQRIRGGVQRQQLGIVIQHLFKMRNHPVVIDGIATETSAQLVVNTAESHADKRCCRHQQCLVVGLFVFKTGRINVQQTFDMRRMGKFRRRSETAVCFIESLLQLSAGRG